MSDKSHTPEQRQWLIFCLRRQVWWCANQAGYSADVADAGTYSDGEALTIIERMNWTPFGDCQVKAVPVNEFWRKA